LDEDIQELLQKDTTIAAVEQAIADKEAAAAAAEVVSQATQE